MLPNAKLFKKGKVREIYSFGDKLLMVATDRISAFDVVLPNGIPDKGKILTALSVFWFDFTSNIIANHLIAHQFEEIASLIKELRGYRDLLEGRCLLVRKTNPLPLECVVRGYLSGSGWREYQEKGAVCGIKLPSGLKESGQLPEPIFTPAIKAIKGHDENVSAEQAKDIVGEKVFDEIKSKSLALYQKASAYADSRGIIIADTKFEFGRADDKIILIDELFTPDSSRFWPREKYIPGKTQPSFDKQFVRDYLEKLNWDKTPPAPQLPEEIAQKTKEKYFYALRLITGKNNVTTN
ncbi:MAG: phosphoribosylaminoimidazolesuccinocarboxamide synthase [bacterium (Candidatus Ratteibacteria) CG_4_10_14_3_um_filter_41_18]|uniref:Phosphoribosylaminoimidazole-succinocarboxamide synthase n=4 Tax=Candidatus Ratteibacteria TaxID=2979319 RepID=A0A2M7E788_9BACT|nr:MAG: phosphoribosylaminoimidazolesuccinocarboxamide synthase [Candidatus Omnitrophica bacterium CG1_02_41_171]PIV63583.1 MAG: phosphoribosylaminoimidazolesuccinocarboxamide synthase [bacterium (Candidatus Ratteibacteria) CG01_land_8_20_14_3_00_40_19]PIW34098.1 MAG: phosphoribosylaminoimidazolesuccinocarboxamide synthase [bacterium (Candidatus Ratteibacteria) CG15_BIG_FIL_POST_REV_8_21_14_020_41_12]PIW73873.1 MAG: phosphoribosylaminoimidazolesuccinocarboxamide synthase [bacterium (Candidatus R